MKYKLNMRRLYLTAIITLLLFNARNIQAQNKGLPQPIPTVGLEIYERVLDLIFPVELPIPGSFDDAWILRYRPSKEADSQITIIKRSDGVEVVELQSMDGNVYDKLQDILKRTGRKDPVEMAKLLHIRKRMVKISLTQVADWHNSFVKSTNKTLQPSAEPSDESGEDSAVLHGTSYSLRYTDGSLEILYNTSGWEVGSDVALSLTEAPPLIVWMNQIWREVRKSSSTIKH